MFWGCLLANLNIDAKIRALQIKGGRVELERNT